MKNLNDNLSKIFDVEPMEIIEAPKQNIEIIPIESTSSVQDDFEVARTNTKSLIDKANTALDNLLMVANQSEHPRAYEVAATLIKNLSDLNKDLMEIQKRKKDLSPQSQKSGDINVDKAVFVGSFTDLVKSIKNNK